MLPAVAAGLATGFILTCRQLTLVLFKFARQYFAPSMAVALLALHADTATLPLYPFLITLGGFYCLLLAPFPRRIVALAARFVR